MPGILSVGRLLGGSILGGTPFSPAAFFAGGEQGAWYDSSDFSTMFQDSAGTTPVTAVEQPVGLVLDKSKGLVLGSELVTNGDFGSALTGWTTAVAAGASVSVVSGQAVLTPDGSTTFSAKLRQNLSLTSGKTYLVEFDVISVTSICSMSLNAEGSNIRQYDFSTTGNKRVYLVAAGGWINISTTFSGSACTIDNISVRELPGNHASQSTPTARPVLKQDANGKYYLFFDGIDDSMATATINPGAVDKVQVFAGVRKLSDAAQGVLAEWSATIASNNGTFLLAAPDGATATFGFDSKGTVQVDAVASSLTAPLTRVVTGLGDISGDTATIRINGVQADQDTGDQGTGNYLSYPLFIGRRGGTTLPFNGNLYQLIVRFSATNLPDATIAQTEAWVNGKTGAY